MTKQTHKEHRSIIEGVFYIVWITYISVEFLWEIIQAVFVF